MQEPLENAELLAFTKTVEASSLSRAAIELGLPRATVGRRLQRLEERLGVRLLRRTTRSLALTDAGEVLYRQARIALDAVRRAEESVRRADDAVRGELRVSVPPFSSASFFGMLSAFCARHPDVRLQMHFSTLHVDLSRGAFDVAIRGAGALEPGLVARTLTRTRVIAVAAPSYLATRPPLRTTADLRHHRCLSGFARGELPQSHWTDHKGRQVHVEPAIASNDIAHLRHAAIMGQGVAYLPEALVRASIAQGALVQVLAGKLEGESVLAVVYAEREFLPPQVRAFVDAVVAWAKSQDETGLWPPPFVAHGDPAQDAPPLHARKKRTRRR